LILLEIPLKKNKLPAIQAQPIQQGAFLAVTHRQEFSKLQLGFQEIGDYLIQLADGPPISSRQAF